MRIRWCRFLPLAVCAAICGVGLSLPPGAMSAALAQEETTQETHSVRGRVRYEDGKPAAGVRVTVGFKNRSFRGWSPTTTSTRPDGTYELGGFPGMPSRVTAESDDNGFLSDVATLAPTAGRTHEANLILRRGPLVTVRVTDAETGKPVPGITIRLPLRSHSSPAPAGQTGSDGVFRQRIGTLSGRMEMGDDPRKIGPAPGYRFERTFNLQAPADILWEVKVYRDPYTPRPATFRGRVVDPDGKPVARALVRLIRPGKGGRTFTGADGRFSFETQRLVHTDHPVPAVLFRVDSGDRTAVTIPTPDQIWSETVIRLTDAPKPRVTGRVTDPRGRPLAGVPYSYMEVFPDTKAQGNLSTTPVGRTDSEGRFEVPGLLPEAVYQIRFGATPLHNETTGFGSARYPDIAYTNGWMRLKSGERRDVGDIIVHRAESVVAGRVVDADGRGVARYYVRIQGVQTDRMTSTDAEGRFRLHSVVPETPLKLLVFQSEEDGFARLDEDSIDQRYKGFVRAGDENVRITLQPSSR